MSLSIDHLETRRREIIADLRERILASGIPRTRFALDAGLSEMTLRRFDHEDWNPSPETIRKSEEHLLRLSSNRNTIRSDDGVGNPTATAQRPAAA